MKHKFLTLCLTAIFGMAGTQVWADELTTTEIDGITYYEIDDAADLLAFTDSVNNGQYGANAVLTADIALTEEWLYAIGIGDGDANSDPAETSFTGIFDGQGHKITGFKATSTGHFGLFGDAKNATIKNFSISGEIVVESGYGTGVVGWPASCTITNVHSALNINVNAGGIHHVGGVVGSARGHNTISRCTFSGTVDVAEGSTDNFAGVVAYLGGDSVSFCANYGTITFASEGCGAGGVAGYLNNTGSYVQNCLNLGSVVYEMTGETPKYGGAIVGRLRTHDKTKLTGNAWLEGSTRGGGYDDSGNNSLPEAVCFTSDKLATGEVCYVLNGDQTTIGWYQTLPGDEQPVLDATHGQVYMNGRLHCNGDIYTDATYSNQETEIIQDGHNIVNGLCDYCGLFDENYMTPNAEGFYEITNAAQLTWFEQLVNKGAFDANAVLTADIDFADMNISKEEGTVEVNWTPIGDGGGTRGTASAYYKGHFDGQGHTIKNLNATQKQNYFALFGIISTGCLIENFTIYGEYYTNEQYAGGVAAYARDDSPTIRNVHSYVNIHNSRAGGRQGGVLGGALGSTNIIENCTYSGTLDGNDAGNSGNYGGIVGYVNNDKNLVVNITNCLFDGEVVNKNEAPGGCTFGGFVGYSNGALVTIKNSLSIGHVESAIWGQFFGAVKRKESSLPNCYYMGDMLNGSASTVTLTATETDINELMSGKICWNLNEGSFLDVAWHQTIDTNDYPVLDSKAALVYQTFDEDYYCVAEGDTEALEDLINNAVAFEEEFIEDETLIAYQALIDEYTEAIGSWGEIESLENFLAAYRDAAKLKESIKASAANYAAYQKACEAAATYIEENGLEGVWTDFLTTYLQDTKEPSSDYPKGSYAYIMENRNLDDEAITAEIDFVNQMLENAIAGGLTSGTEVTRLMANSNFANDFEGWTTEEDGAAVATGGVAEILKIARGKGSGKFSISQTLTDMPNGIYVMSANGMFRAGGDDGAIYNQFYAGQLYLNDTYNYFMSPGEDAIPAEEAEPGVNCLGEDGDAIYSMDDGDGFVPKSFDGCSYAYSAGRYQNFCATEVADGTLTIGVRSLGTGLSTDDWMPFGNIHVYYLGTAEEASEKLSEVLESYAARAQVIVDFFASEDPADFKQYPNVSESLKEQLAEAIANISEATTGEAKMALINTFSGLFNEVHACRMAYIAMYDAANKLFDFLDVLFEAGLLTDEEYENWNDAIFAAQDHYTLGDVSKEEALAVAEGLNLMDQMLPQVDGAYQLGSAAQAKLFAITVNNGETSANAVLTADIDMTDIVEENGWTPIGASKAYVGHFDGQGHTITGFNVTANQDNYGFFGSLSTGALVENFSIYGTIAHDNSDKNCGMVGYATDNKPTIRNIHSYLTINNTLAGARIGGILGATNTGTVIVENCTYSGTLDGNDNAGNGNYGGIVGYIQNNGTSFLEITNCLFDGQLINTAETPGNCTFGGMVGYVGASPEVKIANCLSIGTVQSAITGQFFGAVKHNTCSIVNSFYQGDNINGSASTKTPNPQEVTKVTDEQLASGEVCFKLNGDQTEINWFQTLGADLCPALDATHKVVLYSEAEGYYNEGGSNKGDLNGDGTINIADAVVVLNAMASTPSDLKFDINGDNDVNIADFVTILNIMAQQK